MIDEKLSAAFQAQIDAINKAIAVERAALAEVEDRDEVRVIQHRIALMDDFKEQVEDARNKVLLSDVARIDAEKKFVRWFELLPQVRTAMDEVQELERAFPLLEESVGVARDYHKSAMGRLSEWKGYKLDRYATKREADGYAAELKRLEKAEDAARGRVREAVTRREEVRTAWFAASEKLNALRFQERLCQPPEPAEHATQVLFAIQ